MRAWRSMLPALPLLSLATAACVMLAFIAFVLAASPSLVNAETVGSPDYAAFAVDPDAAVVAGTVVGISDGLLGVQELTGQAPVAFPVASGAVLSRAGQPAALRELRANDQVRLTVDLATGQVIEAVATPAPSPRFQPSSGLAALAALGLVAATALLLVRRRTVVAAGDARATLRRTGLDDLAGTLTGPARRPQYTA